MSGSQVLTPTIPADSVIEQGGFKLVSVEKLNPELKQALKDTVAHGTSDTQLAYFLTVADAQGLNPWMREVWCILYGGKLTIQTGRDGYLKIAKRDPQFDSIQSAEVREGDHFVFDAMSGEVEHRFGLNRGKILGAYAVITRKDGKKLAKYLTLNEYQGASDIWKRFTSSMICKAAESAICKQFANISGVMAEELMGVQAIDVDSSPTKVEASANLKDELMAKIAACKTLDEFNAFKETLPPLIGKLFKKEQDEVYAAATAKKAELVKLDVQDAEIVEKAPEAAPEPEPEQEPETPAEDAQEQPKATVDDVKTMLRECETLEALEACWKDTVPTLGLSEIEMQAVQKTYEMRRALKAGEAPKKRKAA